MNASSKKLHGNGRWESSRMMLPEHREQYLGLMNRDRLKATGQSPDTPTASREELQLMHDSILLQMAYIIAEKNHKEVEEKARSLRDLFVKASKIILQRMRSDINKTNHSLKQANITIIAGERINGIANYSYKCHGHNGSFTISRDNAKSQIGKLMTSYINGLF